MLKMVTMTGADDSTDRDAMLALSDKYSFVEWGVLASVKEMGYGRFPCMHTIRNIQQRALLYEKFNICLHLCGAWVRQLLHGDILFKADMTTGFKRIQLNFHAENTNCAPAAFWNALSTFGAKQFIFQIDGAGGNKHLESIYGINEISTVGKVDAAPLFDISGGAGTLPPFWPMPRYTSAASPTSKLVPHGYAGGLGPHNLAEQLPKIIEAAGECDIWIDMETHVRTDEKFDLAKVERCLEIAAPYINI